MGSKLAELAFGRIMLMASRPEMPGDGDEYERCRQIIFDEIRPDDFTPLRRIGYAADYGKGDVSQWS